MVLGLSELDQREPALQATQEASEIYRQLAQLRPDAFLPNLAMSLGACSQVLAGMGRWADAATSSREGLHVLMPGLERYPQAFGALAGQLARDHILRSKQAGQSPDMDLLAALARILKPDDPEDAS